MSPSPGSSRASTASSRSSRTTCTPRRSARRPQSPSPSARSFLPGGDGAAEPPLPGTGIGCERRASNGRVSAVPPPMSLQSLKARADRASTVADAVSDAELLRAVADGSDSAFEELRHRYRGPVERVCRSIIRGSAEAWLLTLTRNVAYNLGAKKEPEPLELAPEDGGADDPALVVDGFWLDAGLARLPQRERQVIELAYFSGLSQKQIADRLGVPLGTVKSWTRRGLHRLATLLGEETSG